MHNFIYNIPTKIYFGEGELKNLKQEILPYGKRVLLVYGGGSIKRNGIYDAVCNELKDFRLFELDGIDPNPRIESVREGVMLCKAESIDAILAIGGGSSIDCSKVISLATNYDGDAWDVVKNPSLVDKAVPLFTILTLSATGSEMNAAAVISNLSTNEKLGLHSALSYPKVSFLDPTYTYSVPKYQTAAGTADIMSHIMENYFNNDDDAYVTNEVSVALLKTCIKYGPIAYAEPEHYEARANLMWASSLAINGLTKFGTQNGWSNHAMEHELSAFFDVTHGAGLACLTPKWMRYVLDDTSVDKFASFAYEVWGITPSSDKLKDAHAGIDALEAFFVSLDLPMDFKALGIDPALIDEMASRITARIGGPLNGYRPLTTEDIIKIYKACL